MEKRKKRSFYLIFTLALLATAATVVSLATDNWVESTPEKKDNTNRTAISSSTVNFGLFKGSSILDFGWSGIGRDRVLKVVCKPSKGVCVFYPFPPGSSGDNSEAYNFIENVLNKNTTDRDNLYTEGLFNYGIWMTCIISAALSIVFGLVTMGFAIFNIFGKPIETITGPIGLYLWNGTASLFAFLEMILFVILFQTTLKKNFMEKDAYEKFDVSDYTKLGYSFFLVLCAVVLFLINIVILMCSVYKMRFSRRKEENKYVDKGVILY